MRRILFALLLLGGCATPPPEAYYSGGGLRQMDRAYELGTNTVGETCLQSTGRGSSADIYCGAWQQPSARVRAGGPATEASLAGLATAGPWRTALDATYLCGAPQPANGAGLVALRLDCTRRAGGWPHVALVALSGGQAWLADGVVPALPAMQRSIEVLSGRATARAVAGAAVLAMQTERQGRKAEASGDVREYDALMAQGTRANLSDNSAAAEIAFTAALGIQEKASGKDSPNLADPLMHLALQLSNGGRYGEADAMFARAASLVPRQQTDIVLAPQLLHYEALDAYNRKDLPRALDLLHKAEATYRARLPAEAVQARAVTARSPTEIALEEALSNSLQGQQQRLLLGLIETKRYEAIVLRDLKRFDESQVAVNEARDLSRNAGLQRPEVTARLNRTRGVNAAVAGREDAAISAFIASNGDFARASTFRDSRPQARTLLLSAAEYVRAGRPSRAVPLCREAIRILREIKSAFEPEAMSPCLDAFGAAAADAGAAGRQSLLREMFAASQLVQGSTTSQQIQQASARLSSGGGNGKVAEAIRAQQDAVQRLSDVGRQREMLAEARRQGRAPAGAEAKLDEQEKAARDALAARDSELQAAAPNYVQLVQQAVTAEDVMKALKPGEAFVAVTLTPTGGWTFVLRDGEVRVGAVQGGSAALDPLVKRVRAAMEPGTPAFDVAAAQGLYRAIFGEVAGTMDTARAMTVAPTGSLLSLPFEVLLTGPADPQALAKAPFLVRSLVIGHVPSAANFVALRRDQSGSHAPNPWFGFGDFRPPTLAQARASFPPSCGDSAELMARLPPLPSAIKELEVARRLTGARPQDMLLGASFTAGNVRAQPLSQFRVLHFATHALLPTDLKCQTEPALITSTPRAARDAKGGLLTASDLQDIKLDADLVILSACNSGGTDGLSGGESLSTLARSFFYGGARSMLITHWEVNDDAATLIIADTLRRMAENRQLGVAAALRESQLVLLDKAGGQLPADFAHPFYWAPFAVIGTSALPADGKLAAVPQAGRI